ncbi:MAG TPA: aromatic acid/H+ symport family MFS transporter [Pseudonocardia sp.]|nr:aromatic acid/H+ symport family MFS transporter [Pseudonocardia sp.]
MSVPPPAGPAPRGAASWPVVTLCALVVIAEGYDLIVFGALLPTLLVEPGWGLTSASAGTIGSFVYLGMLVGALAGGPVCDRFGRRRFVNVAVAWFTVWTVACALAQAPWQLGVGRLLAGLGMGAVIPASVALAREYTPAHRGGLTVTILMAGIPVGGMAASLLGLVVLPAHGWRAMFLIGGLISVLILAASLTWLPESDAFRASAEPRDGPARGGRFAELFRGGRRLLSALFALASFANLLTWYGLNTWLTTLMRELGYPLRSALQFSLTLNTGAVVGSFLLVALAARWGNRRVAVLCALLASAGTLACAIGSGRLLVLLVFVAVIGAGAQSALNLVLASVADSYPARIRATALGWSNGMGRLGAVVAPALGGAILTARLGPRSVLLTFSGTALAAAVVISVLVLLGRRDAVPEQARTPVAAEVGR